MANFEANASDNAYKQAGVDIAAGNTLVEKIKPAIKKTQRSGSMGGLVLSSHTFLRTSSG